MIYSVAKLLYVRSYTPLHVGAGRAEKVYVDLPIQRDEYGYPVIWASSFKGAIKANVDPNIKKYLGSEPGEVPSIPSVVSLLDARLLLIPVRTINKIWVYATSIHLLNVFKNYLEVLGSISNTKCNLDLSKLPRDKVVASVKEIVHDGKALLNEVEVEAVVDENLLKDTGLEELLPNEIKAYVDQQGIVVLPNLKNLDLHIINKSIIIQYRIRLKSAEEKIVAEGGLWSEEYLPIETVFVSLMLCRDAKPSSETKGLTKVCDDIETKINNKFIYLGGKETIGKGLVKLYVIPKPGGKT